MTTTNGLARVGCMLLIAASLLFITTPLYAQNTGLCANPRQAVVTFDINVQGKDKDLEQAARCFDFSGHKVPREEQLRIPVQLKTILNAQGIEIQPERIPDKPDYVDPDSGRAVYDFLGKNLPGVTLHKVGERWIFTPSAVERIPVIYDDTFAFGIQKLASKFPVGLHAKLLGVKIWQMLVLLLLIVLAWMVATLIQNFLARGLLQLAERTGRTWGPSAVEKARTPLRLILAAMLMKPFVPELLLPVGMTRVLDLSIQFVVVASCVVIAWRLIDVLTVFLQERAAKTNTRLDDQLVPLVRKTLKFILVIVATLFILQNLDVDVGSLLAGLGLGGLAIALAAKDTLANMFGSVMIFTDRPFQIGDWVSLDGVEGTVEEVGFRSTRIRTFYKSLVTVPNSTVANATVDNLGARTYRRLKTTVGITYDATPDQIEAFVEGIRAILKANPGTIKESFEVHFNNFGDSSIDILIYCFLDVPNWSEELRQRQNIFLEIMRLADAIGVSFAFPTQSLHIASARQPLPAPEPRQLSRDALAQVVDGFGPEGDRATSNPGPLTATGHLPGTDGEGADG